MNGLFKQAYSDNPHTRSDNMQSNKTSTSQIERKYNIWQTFTTSD